MMFVSGIRMRWFIGGTLGVVLLVGGILWIYFYQENTFIQIFGTSFYYRLERLINWSQGSGLQLENAMAAIGSAGLFGHGYNQTPIYFPESSTDFIFAVFACNFGSTYTFIIKVLTLVNAAFDLEIPFVA